MKAGTAGRGAFRRLVGRAEVQMVEHCAPVAGGRHRRTSAVPTSCSTSSVSIRRRRSAADVLFIGPDEPSPRRSTAADPAATASRDGTAPKATSRRAEKAATSPLRCDEAPVLLKRIAKAHKKILIVVLSDSMADASPFYDLGMGRVSVLQRPVPNDVLLSFFEDSRSTSSRASVRHDARAAREGETSKFMSGPCARAEIQEAAHPREIPSVSGADLAVAYRPRKSAATTSTSTGSPREAGLRDRGRVGEGRGGGDGDGDGAKRFPTVSAGTQEPARDAAAREPHWRGT